MIDLAIIGGGPAALGAALYAARGGLSVTVFEKMFVGGQAATTHAVDNYLGFSDSPSGEELAARMRAHAEKFPVTFKMTTVKRLELSGEVKKIYTRKEEYEAKSVILAMGASPRPLGIERESSLRGSGVSYCATCDGMFYKGKRVAVVGGGDTAFSDALYLSSLADEVTLIHRRDTFRAANADVEALKKKENVKLVTNAVITELLGENTLSGLKIKRGGSEETIDVSALFVAVGSMPETELVRDFITLDESGYIVTDEEMRTSLQGVFAAGDIRKKPLRQIITAVSDGAIAAESAIKYLRG